jgi:release factor glutamine methyltransferase
VALAIAQERPLGRVVATDSAPVAVATALANATRLGLADRVQVLEGEWYAPVAAQAFDLIASNPPYIASDDPRVEPAVRRFEPGEALFAGPTGLEALQHIVAHAPGHLVAGGWLVLEHGDLQGEAVRALLQATGFVAVRTSRDLAGRERCTEARHQRAPA